MAERQLEAGNVSELDRATEAATYQQAKLDLVREEVELLEAGTGGTGPATAGVRPAGRLRLHI